MLEGLYFSLVTIGKRFLRTPWNLLSHHHHHQVSSRQWAHKASTLSDQYFLSCATALATFQLFHPSLFRSFSTALGLPLALRPSGVHPNAVKHSFSPSLLSLWPSQCFLLLRTSGLCHWPQPTQPLSRLSFSAAIESAVSVSSTGTGSYPASVHRSWWSSKFHSHIEGPAELKSWIGVSRFSFLFL